MKNKQFIIGNLGQDPETIETSGGNTVTKFAVAVTYKTSNSEETTWFNCVAWNKTAELCRDYLKKGSKVALSGRTVNRSYEKDGQKRYVSEVIVDEVNFLTPKEDKPF